MERQLETLSRLGVSALREKYQELFGEPSRSDNRDFLFKRCAWRLQSLTEGTLSERAKRRAAELARDADIRLTIPRTPKQRDERDTLNISGSRGGGVRTVQLPAPVFDPDLPPPGTVLTRDYRGKQIQITVLPADFEHDGTVYKSLSAVAKAVTGSHWNGYAFFNLTNMKDSSYE